MSYTQFYSFYRIATSPELGGLLSDSGFLEAMYLSDLNSRTTIDQNGKNEELANIDLGCKTVALYSSLTSGLSLCPCQLAGHGIGQVSHQHLVNKNYR